MKIQCCLFDTKWGGFIFAQQEECVSQSINALFVYIKKNLFSFLCFIRFSTTFQRYPFEHSFFKYKMLFFFLSLSIISLRLGWRCSHVELLVAFGAREDDVDPDAHRFRAGRHQVVGALARLDAKRQLRIGRPHRLQMVDVHFLDSL